MALTAPERTLLFSIGSGTDRRVGIMSEIVTALGVTGFLVRDTFSWLALTNAAVGPHRQARWQLMEWSGRAPAPPASDVGGGECQTEHRHVQ